MNQIEGVYREVIEKSEWVAISTTGADGPHLAACWTRNVLALGLGENEILFPAGRYEKTSENLQRDRRVELLFVARDVARANGQKGQGCTVVGTGELQVSGPKADKVKAQFPWARGALVVKVTGLRTHLP
ncbi:MAG: pyridoxamine 5'-phosphate oxidase family protein [Verrucomicrobiota bacterium]